MNVIRHAARGLQGAAIALLMAACGGGGGTGAGGGALADPAAAGTIGAAGGEVAFADGRFRLAIPAGALAAPTAIKVTELTAANVPSNLRSINADRVYRLEPAGTQFAVPATATVALPAIASGAIAVMALESNGSGEYAGSQVLTMSASGRTLTGSIPHFSNLVAKTIDTFTVSLTLQSKSIAVGGEMSATVTLAKSASTDYASLFGSSFGSVTLDDSSLPGSAGPIAVSLNAPPPTGITFERNVARTATGAYSGTCTGVGPGYVAYTGEVADVLIDAFGSLFGAGQEAGTTTLYVVNEYQCTAASGGGDAVATGVFPTPFGLISPDVVRVFVGPFANLGEGPLAAFAGVQGTVVADLKTGLSVLNWTPGGAGGAKLGANLIGVLPVKQPGANGIAALFGYGNGGSTLTNFVPAINGFGATGVGSNQVLDANTAGGGLDANAFFSAGARGIEFFAFDPGFQLYGGSTHASLPPSAFDGQVVSAAWPQEGGPVLALTRQADGGAASKLYKVRLDAGGSPLLLATLDAPQARRLRCFATTGSPTFACVATLSGGQAKFFNYDPAATAAPAFLTVPTGAGSLGVDGTHRANGNFVAVVANFDDNSLLVIETTPDASSQVASTTIAAPPGCDKPAHPALFTDSEGAKGVVSCFGSNSYWVFKY